MFFTKLTLHLFPACCQYQTTMAIPLHPHETMLPQLLCAHLVGDFLLQNQWMASSKMKSSLVCAAHVACYMIPFSAIAFIASPPFNPHIPLWMLCAISAQHFLQDR